MVYHARGRGNSGRSNARSDIEKAPAYYGGSQYTLTCGCTKNVNGRRIASLGDLIYCRTHNDTVAVHQVQPEYSIFCVSCPFTRYYGQAKMTAEVYASKHSIARHHAVRIYYGSEVIGTTGKQHQLSLVTDDAPPF